MHNPLTYLILSATLCVASTELFATQKQNYTLPEAIDYALSNNPDLQIMQEKIILAKAQLGIALSSFYPSIKTRLSYEHSANPSRAFGMIIAQRRLNFSPSTDFNNPGGTDNYRPEITASYSLFRGGQDYFKSKAARLDIEVATLEKAALRNQLVQMISSTFYAYLASLEADKIALRSITAVENELKQSRIRYQAGSNLRSDVLSLQVQLAEAQDNKIQTRHAIEIAHTSLKQLLGLTANQAFKINTSTAWDLPKIDQSFTQLLQVAMQHRPEIKAANKSVDIAQQRLNAARGAYLPKADAYLSYGSNSKDLEFSSNSDNVTAGVIIEMDVFSGFRDQQTIKQAQHTVAIAQNTAKSTQLSIENAVKSAHLNVLEALARVKVTLTAIEAAEEALRLVKDQREAGTATITRYIEAKVARDTSYARNIAARFDALQAEAALNQAMGILNHSY